MATRDNLIYELKADAGQSAPKNNLGLLEELTGGTISLVDTGGGVYAWEFSGAQSTATLPPALINCGIDNAGCTLAITFQRVSNPTVANQGMVRWLNAAADGLLGIARGNSISPTDIRTQAVFVQQSSAVKASVSSADLKTYVIRLHTGSVSLADVASIWYQTTGRSGSAPDYVGVADTMTSKTLTNLLVDTSNGGQYRIRDLMLWTRELTDAEGAAVADDLRTATAPPPVVSILSGDSLINPLAASGGFSSTGPAIVSGDITLGEFSASGILSSAAVTPGGITSPVFKNWSGTILPGLTIPKVAILKVSDMSTVLTLTSQTTNGSGVLSISNAALVPGTPYLLVTCNADGSAFGCEPVTAT